MKYQEGIRLYQAMKTSGSESDADWRNLYSTMLRDAVEYAHTRANWGFADFHQYAGTNESRTIQHDAFIYSLRILARYVKSQGNEAEWEPLLEKDRKAIGDLACYIHCALSIQSR